MIGLGRLSFESINLYNSGFASHLQRNFEYNLLKIKRLQHARTMQDVYGTYDIWSTSLDKCYDILPARSNDVLADAWNSKGTRKRQLVPLLPAGVRTKNMIRLQCRGGGRVRAWTAVPGDFPCILRLVGFFFQCSLYFFLVVRWLRRWARNCGPWLLKMPRRCQGHFLTLGWG